MNIPAIIGIDLKDAENVNGKLAIVDGFSGTVYATEATCALCRIMLLDSANIQVSDAEWENYIEPIQKLPRELSENVMQALTDDAASVTPDAQGRIVIPQSLLDKVGITKNATVAGRGAYLEIWAEEVYAEKQSKRDLTSMLEQLSAYGL